MLKSPVEYNLLQRFCDVSITRYSRRCQQNTNPVPQVKLETLTPFVSDKAEVKGKIKCRCFNNLAKTIKDEPGVDNISTIWVLRGSGGIYSADLLYTTAA